jgi:3-dehydroquinate dehydratase/shikimate dehydrogenase
MESTTLMAAPLAARDMAALESQAHQALTQGADVLEWRADYLVGLDASKVRAALHGIRARTSLPVVVTCRDPREGGQNNLPGEVREEVLCAAIAAGADYIDLELDNAMQGPLWEGVRRTLEAHAHTRLILSSHAFEKPFPDLRARYRQTKAVCASAIPKLVYMAHHLSDCFPALDLLHGEGRGAIVLAMGEAGLVSRILARKLGAHLTFASLDEARATAPGQLSLSAFKQLFRADAINAQTEIYGLIGDPIGHSQSPAIHNACFARLGMNRLYLPFWIQGGDGALQGFLDHVAARPWLDLRGFSVTIPHKHAALAYVQSRGGTVEPLTAKIGASNTLTVAWPGDTAHWSAYNTDYSGAMHAIRRALKVEAGGMQGWPVAVIGAGGVARALVAGLVDAGTRLTIYNRTVSKAERLAAEFGCAASGLEGLSRLEARLIVNGTSVGMSPQVDAMPVPPAALKGVGAVFDTVYNPRETRLLREARSCGAIGIDGVAMFVSQALEQFRLFTGQEGDAGLMEEVLSRAL